MSTSISICIADDQIECLQALKLVLTDIPEIVIYGQAGNGEQLVDLVANMAPDVVITDISMSPVNGIDATYRIRKFDTLAKIIALTQYRDEQLLIEMMRAGADGYLIKSAAADTVREAITSVIEGRPFFCPITTVKLQQMLRQGILQTPFKPLPPHYFAAHEKELLLLLGRGLSGKQIADRLGLSLNTINQYRYNLRIKTGMENDVMLVLFAILHNVFTQGDLLAGFSGNDK